MWEQEAFHGQKINTDKTVGILVKSYDAAYTERHAE